MKKGGDIWERDNGEGGKKMFARIAAWHRVDGFVHRSFLGREFLSATILIANGPNLNLLGTREPDIYGYMTLAQIDQACRRHVESQERIQAWGQEWGIDFFQTNDEAHMMERIHGASEKNQGLILNAGAWTHTSLALLDALKACPLPIIEVHLSNIWKRESFRHHSYVAPAAHGCIVGFGAMGYILALDALAHILTNTGLDTKTGGKSNPPSRKHEGSKT